MSFITKKDKVKYWLKTADQDWKVANHFIRKAHRNLRKINLNKLRI